MNEATARPWVVITGCSSGIGRALVESCRATGWEVVATARSLASLQDLPAGPDLRLAALDVTRPESLQEAVAACAGLRLAALVNNAGYGQMAPLEFLRPEELRAQLETNVVGLHAATLAFLPLIRANAGANAGIGGGRIVHVASVLGRMSVPCAGAYNASKHAVVALGETLRLELEPEIKVLLVEPGAIQSEFRSTLARLMGDLPERVKGTRFESILARYIHRQETHAARHGLSARECARRITAAMTRRDPPRRLVVGADARWYGRAKALLPMAVWEWGVRRAFHLGR